MSLTSFALAIYFMIRVFNTPVFLAAILVHWIKNSALLFCLIQNHLTYNFAKIVLVS